MPPQDIAAEQGVLGGMMLSKDAIADVVEVIKSQDFYRPAHELIYDAILDLYSRGEPADPVTVSAELTNKGELTRVGGTPYLHDLISTVPTAANAAFYARIVAERAVLRRLVEAGTRIVQMGYGSDGMDVEAVVNSAQAEMYAVTEKRTKEDYAVLGDVIEGTIDEIEASSHRGEGMVGVPTGFADLDNLTNGLHPGQMIVIAARPAVGKALALDTPLPTPTGWTTMGEVAVGDELLGADGRPTTVVAATDVMVDRPCYEVHFSDGSVIVADEQHQWLTTTRASRRSAAKTPGSVRTTGEIAASLRVTSADHRLNHAVPLTAPLALAERELLIPPYVLGAWLGDGHSASARVTTADPELVVHLEAEGLEVKPLGNLSYSLCLPKNVVEARACVVCGGEFVPRTSQVKTCGRSCGGRAKLVGGRSVQPSCPSCGRRSSGFALCAACRAGTGTLQARLRTIGVLGDKNVPTEYLRASEAQRRALLAGLLDTDGTVAPSGVVQFAVTSRRLACGFRELVHSLGYRSGWSEKPVRGRSKESSISYTVTFSTDDDVFRLERKRLVHKDRRVRTFHRRDTRFITDVRSVPSVPVRCVEVSNEEHLYLAGRTMIPTHNSTLGLDIARAASIKHGLASVIFSLEMGRNEIAMRLLSAEARVPLQKMRKGSMDDADWTRFARTMGSINEAPLYIDDSPNMSLMEIRSKCRRLKQRADLKLVIVDYLQLMTSGKRVESRQQEVSEFSRALKLLAKEIEVPVIALSQLNRGPEQRTDKRPMVSDLRESGCLTADTRVLRADTGAETTMEELFALQARDVPVWALDESLRYVRRHLTHVFPTGVKPVFRLRTASGKEVRATANHPFLTYDGWKPLGELAMGDSLAVPRHVPAPERLAAWDDARVVLLARLLGGGRVSAHRPVSYRGGRQGGVAAVTAAAATMGLSVRAHGAGLVLSAEPGAQHPVREFFDELGLQGTAVPRGLPAEVFHLPKSLIALFLAHLSAEFGTVDVGSGVRLTHPGRRLLDDVALLLLRFGISAVVRRGTGRGGFPHGWTLDVAGRDDVRRFLQEIGIDGRLAAESAQTLAAVVDRREQLDAPVRLADELWAAVTASSAQAAAAAPDGGSLATVVDVLDRVDLDVHAVNDVLWDEIVAIEPDGEEQVYDATVVGGHNFVANGIAVHNSIEQDADMVILLHREDMYEKESPRAGEADFIVAKHRNGPTDTITVAFQGHYSRFVDMAT
ncbi:replicative DNA helicase [Kineococcus endophyticus]|uniref:Replicative DNA helicase n=1 Tax=Kineococcus endophyticus TaxID=1181883 RepID=A0ABV3P5Y8_9ACTN